MASAADNKKPKGVRFTIDGRPFTLTEDKQEASALLRLAGLDPAGYDLAEIRPGGKQQRYEDDTRINIKDGDKFVTIRQSAEVA